MVTNPQSDMRLAKRKRNIRSQKNLKDITTDMMFTIIRATDINKKRKFFQKDFLFLFKNQML